MYLEPLFKRPLSRESRMAWLSGWLGAGGMVLLVDFTKSRSWWLAVVGVAFVVLSVLARRRAA